MGNLNRSQWCLEVLEKQLVCKIIIKCVQGGRIWTEKKRMTLLAEIEILIKRDKFVFLLAVQWTVSDSKF